MAENKTQNPKLPEQLALFEGPRYNTEITGHNNSEFDILNGLTPEIPSTGNITAYKPKKQEHEHRDRDKGHKDPITPPVPVPVPTPTPTPDPIDPPITTPEPTPIVAPTPLPIPTPVPTPYKEKTVIQKIWQGVRGLKYLPHILVLGAVAATGGCEKQLNPLLYSQPAQQEIAEQRQPQDNLENILILKPSSKENIPIIPSQQQTIPLPIPNIEVTYNPEQTQQPTLYTCGSTQINPAIDDPLTAFGQYLSQNITPLPSPINREMAKQSANQEYMIKIGNSTLTIPGVNITRQRRPQNIYTARTCDGKQIYISSLARGTITDENGEQRFIRVKDIPGLEQALKN